MNGLWTRFPWARLKWPVCIALVVLAACAFRRSAYAIKICLEHDEAISLMSAACHQGDYERARVELSNHWVPASVWKAFLTTDRVWCFGVVRNDLTVYDLHPPLFFWLMHLTGIVAGFGATTGAKLNTIVHGFGLVGFLVLTAALTRSRIAAVAAAILWSFSTIALETTINARQYELLGTLGIFCALSLYSLLVTERRVLAWSVALAVSLAGMTLTQWFGLAGSVLVATVALGLAGVEVAYRRSGKVPPVAATRCRALGIAWAGGQALTFAAYPRIASHYREVSAGRFTGSWTDGMWARIRTTLSTLGEYFGFEHGESGAASYFICFSFLLALAVVPLWRIVVAVRAPEGDQKSRALSAASTSLAIPMFGGIATIPFILGVGSGHSMAPRYLSLLSPMWALGLAWPFAAVLKDAGRLPLRILAGAVFALSFFAWPVLHGVQAKGEPQALCGGKSRVSNSLPLVRTVVTDNTHRGTFGPSIPFIRDDARVFAFPPGEGQVPERPHPPPLDRDELTRGLVAADAATFFHRQSYGVTAKSLTMMGRVINDARLETPQPASAAWLLALKDFVTLVAYMPKWHGAQPEDLLGQLRLRGSAIQSLDDVEAFAAVLVDGKVQKEVLRKHGAARLSSSDVPLGGDEFKIVSGSHGSSIRIHGDEFSARQQGFIVVVYDQKAHQTAYSMLHRPGRRPRIWFDVAARMTP